MRVQDDSASEEDWMYLFCLHEQPGFFSYPPDFLKAQTKLALFKSDRVQCALRTKLPSTSCNDNTKLGRNKMLLTSTGAAL
jgi:hypothetical protein